MINFPSKEKYDGDDLRAVVETLRGEGGCPWDREQTHETLRRNLLEETAELCEAIDKGDTALMREELGDVWLQVLFHASIEQERGNFTLDDVADAECRKLISRHPHVFGDRTVADLNEELAVWEDLKRAEKKQSTAADAMDGVCRTLPGLWRAEKIQKKAAHNGVDKTDPSALMYDIYGGGELLAMAIAAGNREDAEVALGQLLFTIVYAARLARVDPEEALHDACEKYIRDFRAAEQANSRSFTAGDAVPHGTASHIEM